MHRKVLVTGGAGFVGSAICLHLAKHYPNCHVVALDNLMRRGSELNLLRLKQAGVEFLHGDIRNDEDLEPSRLDVDLIFECSAEPSVLAGYENPNYVLKTNLCGTINCLELARKTKADFVFLSTSRVYPLTYLNSLAYREAATRFEWDNQAISFPGVSQAGIAEEFPIDRPRTLYGTSKLASEMLVAEYSDSFGIRSIINRCGVLTGPWQMGKVDQGVFALWMARHFFQQPLKYIGFGGSGKQVRDLLHVNDLIALLELQLEDIERLSGEVFNVGGGREASLSLLETTELCQQITGNTIRMESVGETRPGDIPIYFSDHRKVTEATGWKPQFGPSAILEEIHDWFQQHSNELRPLFL